MKNNDKKFVAIITGPGYEDAEVIVPYYRFLEEGFLVDVITSNDSEVKGKHGYVIAPTKKIKDLKVADYEVVIVPGGYEAPDRVRQVPELVLFVKQMFNAGKLVSTNCHGPWVLIEAGIVKGKKVTCYKGMKTDLINAGANYVEKDVVVDGNLISSDHPRSIGPWMKATIEALRA